MSERDVFGERLFHSRKKNNRSTRLEPMTSKQSLSAKFDEISRKDHAIQEPHTAGNWCEVVSSLSNVNAKQAWKSGAGKLSQTFNNFRTTFGVLSQRIKKSTKKRQPLVNVESPVTPYTRSRVALGRTPTKLYSPFSIDSPTGKENNRCIKGETHSMTSSIKVGKKKLRRTRLDLGINESSLAAREMVLSNDLLQTQIGIYEFQSVANRIVQNGAVLSQANLRLQFNGLAGNRTSLVDDVTESDKRFIEKDLPNDEVIGDLDFEDDYSEDLISSFDSENQNVHSVTHLHQKQGEILVPCFGMWWPVGGPTYEYDDDYDDNKKKKRRRSRKQKKAARMKKKRS